MRVLTIDETPNRRFRLWQALEEFGPCDFVPHALEAIENVQAAASAGDPYGLICLRVKTPGAVHYEHFEEIRAIERASDRPPEEGALAVLMAPCINKITIDAFRASFDAFFQEPVKPHELVSVLKGLGA